jgi:hypothetical protein
MDQQILAFTNVSVHIDMNVNLPGFGGIIDITWENVNDF